MNILWNVASVIRTYENNRDSAKAVKRALHNGVGLVIVVVNSHDENQRGRVREDLKPLMSEHRGRRLTIIEMKSGFTWSNALNVAFAQIHALNRVRMLQEEQTIEHVLNCSVEVLWERSMLDSMLTKMAASEQIGVVGTSFDGRLDGNRVSLGNSYRHPRNTCMLVRWSTFKAVGLFDPICDGYGGMEDLHFLMNMFLFEGMKWEMLEARDMVRLVLGKHYNQNAKEQRETAAMTKIVEHFKMMCDGLCAVEQRLEYMLDMFSLR